MYKQTLLKITCTNKLPKNLKFEGSSTLHRLTCQNLILPRDPIEIKQNFVVLLVLLFLTLNLRMPMIF
jgi:hypothetical protein